MSQFSSPIHLRIHTDTSKREKSKDCFSLGVNVSILPWFHCLFHSGGFPFRSGASWSRNLFSIKEALFSEAVFFLLSGPCFAPSEVWLLLLPQPQPQLARAPGQASLPAATQPLGSNCLAPNRLRTFWSQTFSHTQPPPRNKCRSSSRVQLTLNGRKGARRMQA